ncbi:NUDIX domain-containing protein [Microbacterium sp.]|uniref:NUDIX domain-containing protein n=1 Tax=Microbacterium sp. TaxID=51671 RepID=UPI0039E473C0
MTVVPPAAGEPRRPLGPLNPGDAWVVADSGERYWGRFGAAGLLAHDPVRGVLLQHRVAWSHFGDTWGLPGGALHEGESALVGAVREAQEEAGVPGDALRVRFTSVYDVTIWSYTTVVADVVEPFEPVISDPESVALEWVALDEVDRLPLHPGFAAAWPALRGLLDTRPVVVVDGANVVGSVPDGWWRDRLGAAARLRDRLAGVGVAGAEFGLGGAEWFPEVRLVVEGQAKQLGAGEGDVVVIGADAAGDDTIVEEAARLAAAGRAVIVVTSDRGLRGRVEASGARVQGAGWILERLER